ncbi:SRPBCC family protein [Streptomyces bathyalis]|uniref:SRPBCC family protein n=1 Tax=Streptomyces bathyalis TaxID=2710756 RepID=A0A7T1WW47_9ACTN|nr:SRPBCC family protein [Streptomyces bathyalis]QPP09655.1 SRPBCC family protein [Streptomyces bathyalis]
MADSALSKFKDDLANDPATDRLKQELQSYLQARAVKAVSGLGSKLGEGVGKLADPGAGPSALMGSLAKGGQALSEGKSPAQAAMTAGTSHMKEMVKDKVKGLFGKGKGKSGGGKSKSVTIVEDIDVGVPVREAYDQWTQFQEFSSFAKGVVSVEKSDDTSSNWKVKVAKSTRSLKANVTEQIPDERISWTTDGAKGTVKGVVTFHKITDNLTRVLLVLEYFPGGFFEKTGNIWRAQGRRARLDLKLYRKFIMMRGEATDGWRGEIRDGEVVVEHEDAVEEEERAEAESENSEDPEAEAEADDEDRPSGEVDEDEEAEGEYDEDEEPEAEYEGEEEDAEVDPEGEYEEELEPEEEYEEEEAEDAEEDERGRRTVSAGR